VLRRIFALLVVAVLVMAPQSVMADPLAETIRVMAATPAVAGRVDIAVHMETQGHLTLANRAGERFTASLDSKSGELERAIATLAPGAKPTAITVHLTRRALFTPWADGHTAIARLLALAPTALPSNAFRAVVSGRSYPAIPTIATADNSNMPRIELAPGWTIGSDWAEDLLEVALRALNRPLKRSDLRIIALTPKAPKVLSSTPRIDTDSKLALIDPIDPSAAVDVVAAARGQVLIFNGQRNQWDSMRKAAHGNDAILVHIETGGTAQPGARNFLWLPVKTPLMKTRAEQVTLLDALTLSAGKRTGEITVRYDGGRLQMDVRLGSPTIATTAIGRWFDKFMEVAGDLSGNMQARSIVVSVPTPARLAELDRRLIKSIPSLVQFGYAALLMLGLIGLPTAWRWFARVWPNEAATDYANAAGFHAARAVRAAIFAVVFMPLAAIVAAPAQLLRWITRRPA
jgi:hypothetical protein